MKKQILQLLTITITLFVAMALGFAACKKNDPPAPAPTPTPTPAPNPAPPTVMPTPTGVPTPAKKFTPVPTALSGLTGFKNPESAVYDQATGIGYFSNVDGQPGEADGKGSISTVTVSGAATTVTHDWVTGLNAPKGLVVSNGKLYVADITEIVEIDIATKQITKHAAPGATFLNDLAVDAAGNVYASNTWGPKDFTGSGTYNRKIYILAPGAKDAAVWLDTDYLNAPNGLFIEGNTMYVATWGEGLNTTTFASTEPGKILSIDLSTKAMTIVVQNVGNLDGIARYDNGFLVTDYIKGQLIYIDDASHTKTIVADNIVSGPADLALTHVDLLNADAVAIPLNGGTEIATYVISTPAPTPTPVTETQVTVMPVTQPTATPPKTFKELPSSLTQLSGFNNPESTAIDPATGISYFSNMGSGSPAANDGNGSISTLKVDTGGPVPTPTVTHDWVTGLNAPKGLVVFNGKLYAADITEIVEIDIASKQITKHNVPGATFLNDLAVDAAGNVYASNTWGPKDFTGSGEYNRVIYQLAPSGTVTEWLKNDDLNAPNGLFIDGTTMYVATWGEGLNTATFASNQPGKILSIDMNTKAISTVKDNVGNLDGIVRDNDGFLVTDYIKGQLIYIDDATKTQTVVVNGLSNPADIGISYNSFLDTKAVAIPVSTGQVATYTISKEPTFSLVANLGGFKNPESVAYDTPNGMGYVSNVDGQPGAADGNGSITQIRMDGSGGTHNWVTGLNAPKGLVVSNGKLYVADITEIVEIEIATKQITKHTVPGATFLNDLAVDAAGNVYASNTWGLKDFTGSGEYNRVIYQLAPGGTVTEWLKNDDLNAPNGLLIEGNTMYVATWGEGLNTATFASTQPGKILSIDMSSKKITTMVDAVGNLDGIAQYGSAKNLLVTDYLKGQMLYGVSDGFNTTFQVIIDGIGAGPADFSIFRNTQLGADMVAIPLNGGTEVRIYQIKQ